MTTPTRARRAWMIGYVVATFLAFPHPLPFAGGRVLDLGLLASLLVPLCLVNGLGDRAPRAAAAAAFGWTVLAHGAVLHFIYVVTVYYGHAPALVGVVAPFLLATYAACLAALFGAGWAWLRAREAANAWTAALLWTALDHLRSMALSGWPWATLGYAQHLNPALLGLAQWTGVYGLSFAVVLGGVALGEAARDLRRGLRPHASSLLALAAVLLLHVAGFATRVRPQEPGGAGETVRVAAIQGNIDQGVKWNAAWVERTLQVYEDLSRQAVAQGADVVVWPETAVPGAVEVDAGAAGAHRGAGARDRRDLRGGQRRGRRRRRGPHRPLLRQRLPRAARGRLRASLRQEPSRTLRGVRAPARPPRRIPRRGGQRHHQRRRDAGAGAPSDPGAAVGGDAAGARREGGRADLL